MVMENFEELSKQWKNQSTLIPEIDLVVLKQRALERLTAQQKVTRRSTIFGTVALSMVIVVTTWI